MLELTVKLDRELIDKIDQFRGPLTREDFVRLSMGVMLSRKKDLENITSLIVKENSSVASAESPNDFVTRAEFEKFMFEAEKLQLEFAALLTRFCKEQGEISDTNAAFFYKELEKLLRA